MPEYTEEEARRANFAAKWVELCLRIDMSPDVSVDDVRGSTHSGILRTVRTLLEVPEGANITAHTAVIVRRIRDRRWTALSAMFRWSDADRANQATLHADKLQDGELA